MIYTGIHSSSNKILKISGGILFYPITSNPGLNSKQYVCMIQNQTKSDVISVSLKVKLLENGSETQEPCWTNEVDRRVF